MEMTLSKAILYYFEMKAAEGLKEIKALTEEDKEFFRKELERIGYTLVKLA